MTANQTDNTVHEMKTGTDAWKRRLRISLLVLAVSVLILVWSCILPVVGLLYVLKVIS